MKKKLLTGLLSGVLSVTLAGLGGCSGTPSDVSDAPSVLKDYVPYDESLRVEDQRNLTPQQYSVFNTVATDDFGRSFVTMDGKDGENYVGMFYFICNGQNRESTGIYDISKITKNGEDHDAFKTNSTASPVGAAHWWGEPVYGYYNSEDPWVMRKHIEMLTMAGVDFLIFDVSNGFYYENVTDVLFPIMQEYYDAGWDVPKFMYYTRHGAAGACKTEITNLYNKYYKNNLYKDLWFAPYEDGKPLITKYAGLKTEDLGSEIGSFFHFRSTQWVGGSEPYYEDGVPWIEFTYPQKEHSGWMNVSTAAHAVTVKMSDLDANPGRGATWYKDEYDNYYFINDSENYRKGPYFEQQWDNVIAHKDDIRFTFVTGWNEWTATKFQQGTKYFTVDNYNAEYSRDIEPTRTDGMGDNVFLQTIRKIREYRAAEAKHYVYPQTTIDVSKDDPAWENVKTYLDFTGECAKRNHKAGVLGNTMVMYRNNTGRNDIESIKVARDGENVYFRVTAVNDITAREDGDTNWMNIWLRTKNGAGNTCQGYNFVLNREMSGNKTSVMYPTADGGFKSFGEGETYVYGKVMIVKVPLSALNLSAKDYAFDFKVTDNVDFTKDYLKLYDTGDAAPCGRLNFSFGY